MNLIPVIREALGLEVNEEFNLKNDRNVVFPDKFRFTDSTLQIKEGERWFEASSMMFKLFFKGEYEVVKLPFRPKEGELYYLVGFYTGDVISTCYAKECQSDIVNVKGGNCYRTKEEAENHVDEWMSKVYGENWKELLK